MTLLKKYLIAFFVSMVPIIELRGGVPIAVAQGLDYFPSLLICVIGNMLPVPFIYLFARKFLLWGAERKHVGKVFRFFLKKGQQGGEKLTKSSSRRGGLFVALMLFVGIPLPGTGAWTGALAASFLNMGIKSTTLAACLGVIIAGLIMGIVSITGVHIFGL